jgi:hypothetical protein
LKPISDWKKPRNSHGTHGIQIAKKHSIENFKIVLRKCRNSANGFFVGVSLCNPSGLSKVACGGSIFPPKGGGLVPEANVPKRPIF